MKPRGPVIRIPSSGPKLASGWSTSGPTKPIASHYAGKLQVGREYQALFSLKNAKYMSIVGTEITHALKAHFDIRLT